MASREITKLADGRDLELWLTEPAEGKVLVYHTGTPSAGPPDAATERAALSCGLQVISVIRPGYAGSSRRPGRSVVDIVSDTDEALRVLGVTECVVAGWSGGGPHALACAAQLPQARAVASIAAVGPYGAPDLDFLAGMGEDNIEEFGAAIRGEAQLREFLEQAAELMKSLEIKDLLNALDSLLPETDRRVIDDEFAAELASSFREAVKNGIDGWLDDDLAFVKPWGFEMEEISVPVFLWQGSADLMVPFAHGRWLVERVPGVQAHLIEGAGHFSVARKSLDRVFGELVSTAWPE